MSRYPELRFDRGKVCAHYAAALDAIKQNIKILSCYPQPVLTTGPGYPGIWQEHNHDSLLYADYDLETAKNSHDIFYHFQRSDGLLPAMVRYHPQTMEAAPGYGQLQTVYPLAASACEIYRKSGDGAFLRRSYDACARYDAWLVRYRDTRGSGLVEMFCEYDTGHDNSARVSDGGIPHRSKDGDARFCPDIPCLPILAPDLSACRWRALKALAEMARALGDADAAQDWEAKAQTLKARLYALCYDPQDDFFYDVDAQGQMRRYRAEHIFRLFLCGILDQADFDRIYEKHILNPAEFAAPYPFPSIALNDPRFNGQRLSNNWGGMAQAHTALETLLWMRQYGREADFRGVASIWMKKWMDSGKFTQEMHPLTGEMSDCAPNFTTSLLAFIKFAEALGYIGG